jgi:hypothetical protein
MLIGFLRIALPAALCCALGVQPACADIYTWVDASGTINVSNLAPPDGVRVTSVIHATAPADLAGAQAARDAAREAQLRTLAERVVQLEDEIQVAQRPAPPLLLYPPVAPPVVQYITEVAPVQYVVNSPPAASPAGGCDGTWMDCGFAWVPAFYPVGVGVLRPPNFPRPHPFQPGPRIGGQPMHASFGNFRRG